MGEFTASAFFFRSLLTFLEEGSKFDVEDEETALDRLETWPAFVGLESSVTFSALSPGTSMSSADCTPILLPLFFFNTEIDSRLVPDSKWFERHSAVVVVGCWLAVLGVWRLTIAC